MSTNLLVLNMGLNPTHIATYYLSAATKLVFPLLQGFKQAPSLSHESKPVVHSMKQS